MTGKRCTAAGVERFCGSFAAGLAAVLLFALAAASLFVKMDLVDPTVQVEYKTLRLGTTLPELLAIIALAAALLGLCRLLRNCTQKRALLFIGAAAAAEFGLALVWSYCKPVFPAHDQFLVWQMAKALVDRNFDGYPPDSYEWSYFQAFPYQGIMAVFLSAFVRLFGFYGEALRAYAVFCSLCAALCLLALCALAKQLGAAPRVQVLCAVLCLLFLPLPLYTSFVYGTLPAPTLALWGGYGVVRFCKEGRLRWLSLPLLLFPLACMAYQSARIFTIAAALALLFAGLRQGGRSAVRCTLAAVAAVAWSVLFLALVRRYFYSQVPIPASTGAPALATVLMGVRADIGFGPGGYDGTNWTLYWECGGDARTASAVALQKIGEALREPGKVVFFLKKTAWQWLDPWFEGLSMNGPAIAEETAGPLAKALAGGVLFAPVELLLRAMLTAVYLFAGVGTLTLRREKQGAVWAQLLTVAFLGGFFFQLAWETKGRYCFPFFLFLLPSAAVGLGSAAQRLADRKNTAK